MIVYITRHGQPIYSKDEFYTPGDPPLSDLGKEQAGRLGMHLKSIDFSGTIYTSPYQRTAQTADIIADILGIKFYLVPVLREWSVEGIEDFTGLRLEQLASEYKNLARDAVLQHPWWTLEYENLDTVYERVKPFLDKLIQNNVQDVLLVGHGASVDGCVRYFLEDRYPEMLKNRDVDWNCSLSTIRTRPQFELLYLSSIEHLLPEQVTSNSLKPADIKEKKY